MTEGTVINQKTLKQEDDFQIQFMTLNSLESMEHSNCAVKTDPFHLKRDLITSSKAICFVKIKLQNLMSSSFSGYHFMNRFIFHMNHEPVIIHIQN